MQKFFSFFALVLNLLKDIFERSKKTLQQVQGERGKKISSKKALIILAIYPQKTVMTIIF